MGFNIAVVFLPKHMDPLAAGLLFAVITFAVGLPCIALWAGSGVAIRRWLASPRRLRAFNCGMAAMLADCVLADGADAASPYVASGQRADLICSEPFSGPPSVW
jgi:hypothetical protein